MVSYRGSEMVPWWRLTMGYR